MNEPQHSYALSARAWNASPEELLDLAQKVDIAHKELHSTFDARDQSAAARTAWSDAAGRFKDALRDMYGGYPFDDRIAEIRNGYQPAVETAIRFLETDPNCFGAGYVKGRLLRALRSIALTDVQADRLTLALLRAIDDDRDRGELKDWRRLAPKLNSLLLRDLLSELVRSGGPAPHRHALWVADGAGLYKQVLERASQGRTTSA